MWPLPRHILEEVYNADKQRLINHPYWSTEFIGLGPYKLAHFEHGSHLDLVAHDDYILGKPRIKVPYFAMVNLIAGEKIVPELVQGDFTAERVVARLREIIPDGPPRTAMLEGLAQVKARLRAPNPTDPRPAAERAANAVLELLEQPASTQTA